MPTPLRSVHLSPTRKRGIFSSLLLSSAHEPTLPQHGARLRGQKIDRPRSSRMTWICTRFEDPSLARRANVSGRSASARLTHFPSFEADFDLMDLQVRVSRFAGDCDGLFLFVFNHERDTDP